MTVLSLSLRLRRPGFELSATGEVPPGVTSVFGPSGCGKTTLLRAVAGLERVDGHLSLGDEHWLGPRPTPPHRRGIAMVFQDGRLFDHLSVAGNLAYAARRAPRPVDLDNVVRLMDLEDLMARRPHSLSGGERQRVALARAVASAPRVLLLDEPLSAIDARRRDELMSYLERLIGDLSIPVLHVSHDISEVARLADHLWLMEAGHLTLCGTVEDVLSDPAVALRLGPRLAGAVVVAQVVRYDPADDLTELRLGGGRVFLPGQVGPPGARRRLRIPAHDVILMRDPPQGTSALSSLPVVVTGLAPGHGPGVAVGLASGEARLIARITRRSSEALGLSRGMALHAIFKATALSPGDIGS